MLAQAARLFDRQRTCPPILLQQWTPHREGSCIGNLGTGIFDDDTTCEVRTHYRSALRAGIPGPELTDQILRDHLE